jgi:hypothetical protein
MNKMSILSLALSASLGMLGVANAAISTPQQPACVQSSFSVASPTNSWYTAASVLVKNNCNTAIDLKNAVISFKSNSGNVGSVWTWPFASNGMTYQNGIASFTLAWQGDQYSPSTLATGKSIALNFGVTLSGQPFSLAAAQQSVQVIPGGTPPSPSNGAISVVVNPTGTTGITGSEVITLTNGNFSQSVTNSTWSQPSTYPVTGLAYGTYTISAAALTNYLPVVVPSSVSLNSAAPQTVTITYTAKPAVGKVSVVLPAAPLSGVAESTQISLKDQTTNQSYSQTVSWNKAATFSNLPANDTVVVTAPTVTNGQTIATPNAIAPFKVVKSTTISKTISYQLTPQSTVPVPFTLNGLSSSNATVSLTDTYGNQYNFANLGNGTVNKALPVSNSYNVSASAPNLFATITPTSFNTTATNQTPVTINFAAAPAQKLQFYWAGWMGYAYDLNGTYGALPITDVYMAFANYSNGQIDSAASGYITNVPKALSQVWPSYQNWTSYAYAHPNVHMMLSVGGATYSTMWGNLNSTQAAKTMASSIVAILNTPYPVYAPASPSQPSSAFAINGPAGSSGTQYGQSALLGYVTMSGVDLDVEVQNLPAITPYLITLAEEIHKAAPTKLITFATFSVAADPVGACTYPGSAHCSEALGLIAGINNNADQTLKNVVSYNVMAYDAGESFVSSNGIAPYNRYQTALQNYTAAVGNPSHVILGLDLQPQWGTPYFTQTCAQLKAQAVWAYEHPTVNGGTFLWEVGDDSNCHAITVLTDMANAMRH